MMSADYLEHGGDGGDPDEGYGSVGRSDGRDTDQLAPEACLQFDDTHGDPCAGDVFYRPSLSGTGEPIARCESHWERRLAEQERLDRDYPDSPIAPTWFDPTYAGERWDDDY